MGGWALPLLGLVGPAGVVVAHFALQVALDRQVRDVVGQGDGGGNEGQVRVRLVLNLARG